MNQSVDSLFKSKLETYASPAPQEAWYRIESTLRQSSNKKLWLKFAAGIALFATASIVLINSIPADEQPHVQQFSELKDSPSEPQAMSSQPQKTVTPATPEVTQLKRLKSPVNDEPQQLAIVEEVVPVNAVESENQALVIEENIAEQATGLVIVYLAEEVNSKYLLKTTGAEATVEQKKSSRIQKLAGLAHNLSNEDLLGDLRDRKNELFALNFLDDKKEKKN
jgi:hypothetical protein